MSASPDIADLIRTSWWTRLGLTLRWVGILLVSPVRILLALRRAMTPASVTLLLFGIVSTNIIWGYPWIGVFSACLSMFLVGWVVNRTFLPELSSDFRSPRSTPAGTPFWISQVVRNRGRLPAMDLDVKLALARRSIWSQLPIIDASGRQAVADPPIALINVGQGVEISRQLICRQRGMHRIPDAIVTTYFPFHLFRFSRRISSHEQIAITPQLLSGLEDAAAAEFVESLGTWSRQLFSGDIMDYTGSREYQPGMPVRRWDFSSWARLGRPIVREYQSPGMRSVNLLVDTSVRESELTGSVTSAARIERVLSMAATMIDRVYRHSVRVQVFVTGQPCPSDTEGTPDLESALIRLAASQQVSEQTANQNLRDWIDLAGRKPTLLLSARSHPLAELQTPGSVSVVSIDTHQIHVTDTDVGSPPGQLQAGGAR